MVPNKNADGFVDFSKSKQDHNPFAVKNVFSGRIQTLMHRANMNQTELAAKLNLATPSTVSKWIAGTNLPRLDTLEKLSQIFDVSPAFLITPMITGLGGDVSFDKVLKWCFMGPNPMTIQTHFEIMQRMTELDEDDLRLVKDLCARLANK